MHPSVVALFDFARTHVTEEDIFDFVPSDPGSGGYIALWTKILRSGELPQRNEFDLSEVILCTAGVKLEAVPNPERFQRFRRFTNSVALGILHGGGDLDVGVFPSSSCIAYGLISDRDKGSEEQLTLLRSVFPPTRQVLESRGDDRHYPFFTFGSMILAQFAGDYSSAEDAASQLIEDEAAVRGNQRLNWMICDNRFLLATIVDRECPGWLKLVCSLTNPSGHEDTQLVIDALIPRKR